MAVVIPEVTILCEAKTADGHLVRCEMRVARAIAVDPAGREASAYVALAGVAERHEVASEVLRETIRTLRIFVCAHCGRREGDHLEIHGERRCPVGNNTWLEEAP